MNTQEREQLSQFLQQLVQAQAGQKDAEAESLIRDACARQPDAAYLLVQRALLLGHAVEAAQAQVQRLQAESEQLREQLQPRAGNRGGFLGDADAWGQSVRAAPAPTVAPPQMAAPAQFAQPAPMAAAPASSWGSGMLGNIATTAAGVVAGSFLFQGIEHLMGQHGGWGGSAAATQPLSGAGESTVINNYYDSGESGSGGDSSGGVDALALDDGALDDIDSSDMI